MSGGSSWKLGQDISRFFRLGISDAMDLQILLTMDDGYREQWKARRRRWLKRLQRLAADPLLYAPYALLLGASWVWLKWSLWRASRRRAVQMEHMGDRTQPIAVCPQDKTQVIDEREEG